LIERERDCVPVPHDLVHGVQALKARTVQWIGHGPWLHGRVSAVCGQRAPPLSGCTFVRERRWKPLPHDLEHVDQAPKLPILQSVGQTCMLHVWPSLWCGHALPPNAGSVSVRVRVCEPVSHDFVQAVQLPQSAMTQSCGQTCVLHTFVSEACPAFLPPHFACTTERVRDVLPVPHDLVHALQAPQEPT